MNKRDVSFAVLFIFFAHAWGQGKDTYLAAYVESHVPFQTPSEGVVYGEPAAPQIYTKPPISDLDKAKASLLPQALKIAALIFKIILKLTLFKIIVKFIAVICLLLFIPSLDFKSSMEDVVEHDGKGDIKSLTMEELVEMVREGVHKYESVQSY